MPALPTTLLATGLGAAALVVTAPVATSAGAAAEPVAAVEQLTADGDPASTDHARTSARGWWAGLTDTQRTCLLDRDISRPIGRLDDAQRTALRSEVEAAAQACDVTLPLARARAVWDGLTTEQQTCIKDAGVTRPWGPLTKEQRMAVRTEVRAAAEKCGVDVRGSGQEPGRE